jgi:hypothetical protein
VTRIVVLGGGFGGIEAMRILERKLGGRRDVELLPVSDTNDLLFTPVLPQVAHKVVGLRKQVQVALDWGPARWFPRDSAIMRRPSRCALCQRAHAPRERDAA